MIKNTLLVRPIKISFIAFCPKVKGCPLCLGLEVAQLIKTTYVTLMLPLSCIHGLLELC